MKFRLEVRLLPALKVKVDKHAVELFDPRGTFHSFRFEAESGRILRLFKQMSGSSVSQSEVPPVLLGPLQKNGAIEFVLTDGKKTFFSYNARDYNPRLKTNGVLSRFAFATFSPEITLSSATAQGSLVIHDLDLFRAILETKSHPALAQARLALGGLGLLESPKDKTCAGREFHDVLFHERTRNVGARRLIRSSYFGSRTAAESRKPKGIKLPASQSKAFVRASKRGRSEQHLTKQDLANLLSAIDPLSHSYPSAGGIYENRIYVIADDVQDVSRALYLYDRGFLERVSAKRSLLNELLQRAGSAWGAEHGAPQALAIVASELSKLTDKYTRIGYRLTLLNAGIILGALDRRANELGLIGSCLGTGPADEFSALIGSKGEIISVAEFAFGARASSRKRAR